MGMARPQLPRFWDDVDVARQPRPGRRSSGSWRGPYSGPTLGPLGPDLAGAGAVDDDEERGGAEGRGGRPGLARGGPVACLPRENAASIMTGPASTALQ